MTKIRILQLMNGIENASIGQIVRQLIQILGDQDYRWYVGGLKNQGELQTEYRNMGAKVVEFSTSGYINTARMIRGYVIENQIDIIHSHTPKTLLLAEMARLHLSNKRNKKLIHIATKHILSKSKDRHGGAIYTLFDYLTLYLPDRLVPVSWTMGNQILTLPHINPQRVTVIPNSIEGDKFFMPNMREKVRTELGLETQQVAIGFVGRIEQVKRLDLLLKAFSEVYKFNRHTHLLIAGEGSIRTNLERLSDQLGISHVVNWIGFCHDIPKFLSALDIYVQPSINEGLSLSILEAMAARKPVIATRVGGIEEVITDSKNGILIPPFSTEKIRTALLDLINQPGKRDMLANNAFEFIQREYPITKMVERYGNLYRELSLSISNTK